MREELEKLLENKNNPQQVLDFVNNNTLNEFEYYTAILWLNENLEIIRNDSKDIPFVNTPLSQHDKIIHEIKDGNLPPNATRLEYNIKTKETIVTNVNRNEPLLIDKIDFSRKTGRDKVLVALQTILTTNRDILEKLLNELALKIRDKKQEEIEKLLNPEKSEQLSPNAVGNIKTFLTTRNVLKEIKRKLDEIITGEDETKLATYLTMTTCVTDEPNSALLIGPTAAGKSWVQRKAVELIPNDMVLDLSRVTPNVLEWLSEGDISIDHKVVLINEASGANDAFDKIKLSISEGKLTLLTTVKDNLGRITPKIIENRARSSYIITNQNVNFSDQLLNRVSIITVDTTSEHNKLVINDLVKGFELGQERAYKIDDTFNTIKYIPKVLTGYKVITPYAGFLTNYFPSTELRSKRDIKKFFYQLSSIVNLYQYQREKIKINNEERLVATLWDLVATLLIFGKSLKESLQSLPDYELEFFNKIKEYVDSLMMSQFEAKEIARGLSQNIHTVRAYLRDFEKAGLVTGSGRPKKYEIMNVKTMISNIDINNLISEIELKLNLENLKTMHSLDDDTRMKILTSIKNIKNTVSFNNLSIDRFLGIKRFQPYEEDTASVLSRCEWL